MMKNKMWIPILMIVLLPGCQNSETKEEKDKPLVDNTVELTVDSKEKPRPVTVPEKQNDPEQNPVEEVNLYEDFFLSGKTELLSIPSQDIIHPEEFEIGRLFEFLYGTAAEKNLVEMSRNFLESLEGDEPDFSQVDPFWRFEVEGYIDYFIRDKIEIGKILYGNPEIGREEATLQLRVFPAKVRAIIYFEKNKENKWWITGLEMDLRKVTSQIPEKWFPVTTSSPLVY
jgi:hypothetical protein